MSNFDPLSKLIQQMAQEEAIEVLGDASLAHDRHFVAQTSKKYSSNETVIRLALIQITDLANVADEVIRNESRGYITTVIQDPRKIVRGGMPAIFLLKSRYRLSWAEAAVVRHIIHKKRVQQLQGVLAHR